MYTVVGSPGLDTTVWVCEPRQVCTVVMYFGLPMSLMSMMRIPRARSRAMESLGAKPCKPQSVRALVALADTKGRFRYTDTALCEPGQTYAVFNVGLLGFEMSHTCQPL